MYFLLYVSQISRGVGNSVAAYTFVTDWILNELWNNLRLSILSVRCGARVLYASTVCCECVYVRSILVLLGHGRNITPECIVIIHVVRLCVLHTEAARLQCILIGTTQTIVILASSATTKYCFYVNEINFFLLASFSFSDRNNDGYYTSRECVLCYF